MNFLQIILLCYFSILIVALLLYIPKLKCWIYGFKKTERLKNNNKSRLAIMIPAKNESECIGPLFESILTQTYDKEFFDVFVIVDRDDDETISIAKNKLINVDIIVEKNQKCKADALDAGVKHILNRTKNDYDAYLIVDADNILDDNFLEEMNNALVTKADIIIGKKLIKNWESNNKKNRTIFANLSALTYTAIDTMGNRYKSSKGCALSICGQGLCLSKKFIDKYEGFPFKSLCEDVEVGIHGLLYDFKQLYYEHALIYSEEPTSHKEYNKRRYRWLKGYFDNDKKYRKQILKKTFKNEKIETKNLHFLYDLFPVYLMLGSTAIALVTFLVTSIVLACLNSKLLKMSLIFFALMVFLIYFMIAFFNFITIIEDSNTNKMTLVEKMKVIFIGPFYTFEYVIIFLRTLRRDYNVNWDHVERIKLDEKD